MTTTARHASTGAAALPDPRVADPAWGESPLGRPSRRRLALSVLVDVVAAIWYFAWLFNPSRVGDVELYSVLAVVEVFNLVQAVGFWLTIVRQRRRETPPPLDPATRVDVFVPRYDEPEEVVAPVLAAALRLRGAEVSVHLLDDGDDWEMRRLAARLGANYIRRDEHVGAKAGNINHALTVTDAPYVAVFDCDHVPHPDFLVETLGHFGVDPRMAFVQTPQHYANAEQNEVAQASWSQQALFFGSICRGKDRLGAMFCCGTNVVFSREALGAEGFPEDTVTEDFLLGLRLHERGWHSAYVPKVLAQGLGPEDMGSYTSQQLRWARGCLSAIVPALRAKLPWRVKAQYLLSSMYFLSGWTVLVYMALPIVRITTGRQPLAAANADQFLLHFGPYFALALLTVALGGGGTYSYRAFTLAAATFWVHVAATLAALTRRKGRFVVTPKSGSTGRQPLVVWPTLLAVAGLATAIGIGLSHSRDASMLNNVAFASVHLVILMVGASAAFHRHDAAVASDPPFTGDGLDPVVAASG